MGATVSPLKYLKKRRGCACGLSPINISDGGIKVVIFGGLSQNNVTVQAHYNHSLASHFTTGVRCLSLLVSFFF